jgi:hypothetical protein
MSDSIECACIKFCAKLEKMQARTYEMTKTAFQGIATAFVKATQNSYKHFQFQSENKIYRNCVF